VSAMQAPDEPAQRLKRQQSICELTWRVMRGYMVGTTRRGDTNIVMSGSHKVTVHK
jgi:hypothetical protein